MWNVRNWWLTVNSIASCVIHDFLLHWNDIECWSKQLHAASVVVNPSYSISRICALFFVKTMVDKVHTTNQPNDSFERCTWSISFAKYILKPENGRRVKIIEMRFGVFAQMNDKSSQLPWWCYTSYQDRMSTIAYKWCEHEHTFNRMPSNYVNHSNRIYSIAACSDSVCAISIHFMLKHATYSATDQRERSERRMKEKSK